VAGHSILEHRRPQGAVEQEAREALQQALAPDHVGRAPGGADVESNLNSSTPSRKARAANMPKDNSSA